MSIRSTATKQIMQKCPTMKISAGHKPLRQFSRNLNILNYFKFSIVRNPFDRFVSLWIVQKLATGISFNTFVNLVFQKKYYWYPVKTQSYWLTDLKNNLLTDQFIKFENYELGIKKVLQKLNLPTPKLPHLRRTRRLSDYHTYYKNDSQIEKVAKIYSVDLKNFGYSF